MCLGSPQEILESLKNDKDKILLNPNVNSVAIQNIVHLYNDTIKNKQIYSEDDINLVCTFIKSYVNCILREQHSNCHPSLLLYFLIIIMKYNYFYDAYTLYNKVQLHFYNWYVKNVNTTNKIISFEFITKLKDIANFENHKQTHDYKLFYKYSDNYTWGFSFSQHH